MKTKLYTLLFFTLTLSSVGIFNSCRQPSNCGWDHTTDVYYNISDANKAKIPYTGNDTLRFKSDAGDTAILYGQGKKTTYTTTTSGNGIADCGSTPQYIYHYENLKIDFSGNNPNFSKLSFKENMPDNSGAPSVTDLEIDVNNIIIALNSVEYLNSNIVRFDSILVNGIYQKGCYINTHSDNVLFSFTEGVLKIIDANNKTWTKLK